MSNTYKGYDLFNNLEDDLLKAWNRANVVANINQALGPDEAENYANHFDLVEKMKVEILLLMVSLNGKEEVQKRVMKCLNETESKDES